MKSSCFVNLVIKRTSTRTHPHILLPSSIIHSSKAQHEPKQTNKYPTNIITQIIRERNINYFVAPIERGTQRVALPVERTVKRIDDRLPLERMALGADRRIKSGIDRVGHAGSVWPGAKKV